MQLKVAKKDLLQRINETDYSKVLMKYIQEDDIVIGVSAGSLIFCNNLPIRDLSDNMKIIG